LLNDADYLFGGGCELPCPAEADVNGDGVMVDITDITFAVDWLYGDLEDLVSCP